MKRTIKNNPFASLTPEEKTQLRTLLESPAYQKMLSIVANFKPSPNCSNAGSGPRDAFSNERTNARLGELRGWEQYEMALFAAINTPKEVQRMVEENFPDAGLMDYQPPESQPPKK